MSSEDDVLHREGRSTEKVPEKVPLSTVFFTHDKISCTFKNGQPLRKLIEDLQSGRVTVEHPNLVLDVAMHEGGLFSFRNRRLYCLKQYAETVGDFAIYVRKWAMDEKMKVGSRTKSVGVEYGLKKSSQNGGTSVTIRQPGQPVYSLLDRNLIVGSSAGKTAPPGDRRMVACQKYNQALRLGAPEGAAGAAPAAAPPLLAGFPSARELAAED